MKIEYRKASSIVIIVAVLLAFMLPAAARAQTEIPLFVNPATANATTCPESTITIAISVEDVEDLTAFHLEISFDPAVIQVMEDGIEPAEFIIGEGETYLPEPTNEIDNVNGFISWGLAKQGTGGDPNPVDGDGDLIEITLYALVPNASSEIDIDEDNSILVNWPDAFEIPFEATDGVVNTSSCAPTDIDLTNNTIEENKPVETVIGYFTTTDADNETPFTYTFVDSEDYPDNASFSITGDTLKSGAIFNYEVKATYVIRVRSTDPWGAYYEEVFFIHVSNVNDAPVLNAIGDEVINELEELTFTATATDEEVPLQTLTFSLVDAPAGANINSTSGLFSWTPTEAQGPGNYTFMVKVCDNGYPVQCDTEEITVTVNEVNTAPVFAPIENQIVNELTEMEFTASATDDDLPEQTLTYSLIGAPEGATINESTGVFTWTPTEQQGSGVYTFTIKVCDNWTQSLCDEEEITVTVNEVNIPPTAVNDAYVTVENRVLTVLAPGVLSNDIDPDYPANTLTTVLFVDIPAGEGTLVLSSSGAFSYVPPAEFIGDTSFQYKVYDGTAYSEPATVTITVTDSNLPPTDISMTDQTILENQPIGTVVSYLSSVDPNLGDTFTYSLVGGEGSEDNDSFSIDGNRLLSDEVFDYETKDSYTIRIRSTDQGGLWYEESFVITILDINDAPIANDQSVTTPEDTALAITLTGSDQDGDLLSFAVIAQPLHGILTGTAPNLTYTPAENYNGSDSFTFNANDGNLVSNTATVSITVTAVNDAPVAHDKSVATLEDTPITISLDASDVDGDPLTGITVSGPEHGEITISNLTVTYTPDADYHGSDSFVYKVNDGTVDSNTATVSITITPVNDPPVAEDLVLETIENQAIEFELLASDPDGDSLNYSITLSPEHGNVSCSGINCTYTPEAGWSGTDSFTYIANDGELDSNEATVEIIVHPLPVFRIYLPLILK